MPSEGAAERSGLNGASLALGQRLPAEFFRFVHDPCNGLGRDMKQLACLGVTL